MKAVLIFTQFLVLVFKGNCPLNVVNILSAYIIFNPFYILQKWHNVNQVSVSGIPLYFYHQYLILIDKHYSNKIF